MQWPSMSVDEWAAYEQRVNRVSLVNVGGIWWRPVRALFFRPLNVMTQYPEALRGPVLGSALGAIQFPVAPSASVHSYIRLIMSEDASSYSAADLPAPVQRHIRKGCRNFTVRRIEDPGLMIREGFDVYREFQARTGYQHLKARLRRDYFTTWVGRLFSFPDIRVLGAFHGEALSAIAITFRVGDSIHYNSYFGNEFTLANRASDCMLHAVRSAAAMDAGVRRVFAAGAGMPRGLDDFYLRRGFRYVDQAAIVRGNPLTLSILRFLAPRAYRKLFGETEDTGADRGERVGRPLASGVEAE